MKSWEEAILAVHLVAVAVLDDLSYRVARAGTRRKQILQEKAG